MSTHPDFVALHAALAQAEAALPQAVAAALPPQVRKQYVGLLEAVLRLQDRALRLQRQWPP